MVEAFPKEGGGTLSVRPKVSSTDMSHVRYAWWMVCSKDHSHHRQGCAVEDNKKCSVGGRI